MTPGQAFALHRRLITMRGGQIALRRYSGSGDGQTHVDTPVLACVVGDVPRELIGSVIEGVREVLAMADDLAAVLPVTVNDKLVVRDRELSIVAVDDSTVRCADTLIALKLKVKG